MDSVEQPSETVAPVASEAEAQPAPQAEEENDALHEEAVAENNDIPASPEEDEPDASLAESNIEIPDTKEKIIERLETLAEHVEQSGKAELDLLKQGFYKILKEERAQFRAQYLKDGGNPEEYAEPEEPLEPKFKKLMATVREHLAKVQEEVERMKEVNLQKKKALLEQIKALAATPEDANKNYEQFRKLQEEWKAIKPIPAQSANEAWKNFQFAVEQYYDLLKENNALRDYDFKKNLEAKTLLCETAEKLAEDPDVIHASHQLQQLHQEFREIGPVAKDLREDLWNRFKAASTAINKRHAQYFEQLKAKEEENLEKKTALCEEIENIETANLQTYAEWEEITKKIIGLQQQWKEIGRAPKKTNTKIFERFRAACDNFFNKKSEHFKEQRKQLAENGGKKLALCEQAEALKDSTEWASTTNKLVQLQNEWKQIGPVSRKNSNALWERFNGACNYFFEQKKKVLGDQRKEENANLAQKKAIVEKLEAVAVEAGQDAAEKVRALMDEWGATGHVPFKEKDKIYAKYREVVDRLFKELDLSSIRRARPQRSKGERSNDANQGRSNSLYRQYESKKAELATYENNFSFLTAHSKNGNALIDNLSKKIETLKADLIKLVERIKAQEKEAEEAANGTKAEPENEVSQENVKSED